MTETMAPARPGREPDATVEGTPFYLNRGVLLPVPPGFSENVADSIRSGGYEGHEASELDGLLQPGEVVLEIGAGCGFISTYCARDARVSSVHCVEANPQLIDIIRLTHRANGVTVEVHNEMLARKDGEMDFYVHQDFWGSGTHSFLGEKIKVPATRFQTRLDQVRPTLIIVDIEGGEETLFENTDLRGVTKIMVELHQPTTGRRGVKRLFDTLSARNFHYDVWHSGRSVVTFSHVDRV